MKKVLFLVALVLISTGSFAQKKSISKARNLCMMEENPDFDQARIAIGEALQNQETMNDPNAWYVAGLIGYRQCESLRMSGSSDWAMMGKAIIESYDYWVKADSLSMIPTYDKKGKAHFDTKTRKMVAEKMVDYWVNNILYNYGVTLFSENNDPKTAYVVFKKLLAIPDMEMMQDAKLQEKMPRDEQYYQTYLLADRFANESKDYAAVQTISRMLLEKANAKIGAAAGEFLYYSYKQTGDTITAERVLDDAITKFPLESWFINEKINNLIHAGRSEEAIAYLDRAIMNDPQAQYYNIKGSILNLLKRYDEARGQFKVAMEMEPENAKYQWYMGVSFFDEANNMLYEADAQNLNQREFNKVTEKAEGCFRQALPYLKEAHDLAPDDPEYRRTLRQLYYRLHMQQEYDELGAF